METGMKFEDKVDSDKNGLFVQKGKKSVSSRDSMFLHFSRL